MMTWMAAIWLGLWVAGGIIIVVCALTRCPKCRGWHASPEEQQQCERKDHE